MVIVPKHHPQGARAVDCGQLVTALCRRSAVSRQACQLICVLSRAMGSQFDSLAVHMMPALFKVLVITVQASILLTPFLSNLCLIRYACTLLAAREGTQRCGTLAPLRYVCR